MAKGKTVTFKVGRDAKSGEFIPVKEAQKRKATTVVETIKRPTAPKKGK
ncbi:hypothetical protein [Nisaea sp.]